MGGNFTVNEDFLRGLKDGATGFGFAVATILLVILVLLIVESLIAPRPCFGCNSSANWILPDLLKKISNEGFGVEVKENVDFRGDDIIYLENILSGTSVPASRVHVCIDGPLGSNGSGPLEFKEATNPEESYLDVKSSVKAAVAVCKGRFVDVKIQIAETKQRAQELCTPDTAKTCGPESTGS